MSAAHFLRHLAVAYGHFNPVDERRKFSESLGLFEKRQLRESLLGQLGALEMRCRVCLETGEIGREELSLLFERISRLKGRLGVFSHESAPVV